MKKNTIMFKNTVHLIALLFMFLFVVSCSEEAEKVEEIVEIPETINFPKDCSETTFPNLGPGAIRGQADGCIDVANPVNIGTLDCRTNEGGYTNSDSYGKYEITGTTDRFDGTRTRVERFFKDVKRAENRSTSLSYKFIIDDLSDGETCIVQAHATGKILKGLKAGENARSAVFLLYATKVSNNTNIYNLHVHESTEPYTEISRGERTLTFLRTVQKGVEYSLTYTVGYDDNNLAYSSVKVGKGSDVKMMRFQHTYTTESVVTRYGAYGAADDGDKTVSIKFKDVEFCRVN